MSHIQWDKKVARPNSAYAWGMAMERMIENPPRRLPLKSHGYLRSVAYEIADDMDRKKEVKNNQEERKGNIRGQGPEARVQEGPERISLEEKQAIRKKNHNKRHPGSANG
ncbi:MAG: hypothetical protein JRD05_08775 [Deltaproteobacteria bacterium]|nr:hypothetical protein [Deltaproteobacteria bacterium]